MYCIFYAVTLLTRKLRLQAEMVVCGISEHAIAVENKVVAL